jgi:hypothetical protein
MDQSSDTSDRKEMLQIYCADASALESLRSTVAEEEGEIGPVANVPRGTVLHFDPAHKDDLYFKVLGVFVTAGLTKLIEWAAASLKSKKPGDSPIILSRGKHRVELLPGTDAKVVRAVLDDLLKRE